MLKANSRNMPIEEIKIYSSFAEAEPARKKVEARKAFYNVTGRFDKAVLIDGNNYLFDGYSAYIAAQEMGMDRLPVLQVVSAKKKKTVAEDKPKFKVGDRYIFDWPEKDFDKTVIELTACKGCWNYFKVIFGVAPYNEVEDSVSRFSNDSKFAEHLKPYTEPEPEQEPVKLYCVKDFATFGIHALKKGKVYEFDGHRVNYDGMECEEFRDFEDWEKGDPSFAACLVPLVSRPAKVGEYITPITITEHARYDRRYDLHDLLRVTEDDSNIIEQWVGKAVGFENLAHPERPWQNAVILNTDYLVIDGYHPEPKYYNGKVVCVESSDYSFTVGKVYNWTDGVVKDNDGATRPCDGNEKITSLDDSYMKNWSYKFIPFNGEQS